MSVDPRDEIGARAALVHREVLQLAALIAAAAAAFLLTRFAAAANRRMNVNDAEAWFARGQAAMASGQLDEAADAFRRAAARRRGNRAYVLSLASTLAAKGERPAARQALLSLRDIAPEDRDVNVALARLSVADGNAGEAQRFYYNALYAPWPADQADARRSVRMELIRLLAARGESTRALAELMAVESAAPGDSNHQKDIAQLFAVTGDYRRALDHFRRALDTEPDDIEALSGAGMAAFHLADYRLARTYLRRTGGAGGATVETRELVELILGSDPLAPRLGTAERRRRLLADLDRARIRLDCTAASDAPGNSAGAALRDEIDAFLPRLAPKRTIDQDIVEAGLDLVSRSQARAAGQCGPGAPLDRALVLIGRLHAGAAQ